MKEICSNEAGAKPSCQKSDERRPHRHDKTVAKSARQTAKRGVLALSRKVVGVANAWIAARAAAGLYTVFGRRPGDAFGILIYHRIADAPDGVMAPTWNVPPGQLRLQLEGLLARGFQAWPLSKILKHRDESQVIPSNVFAVTFDDGYENNFTEALPILSELNVPATIFLVTAFLDSDRPFPFDDWPAAGLARVPVSAWRPLSTDQCFNLLNSGLIEFGAHTHTHRFLFGQAAEFQQDLSKSLDVLRERFGVKRPAFAFPFGAANAQLIAEAKQAELACSFTLGAKRIIAGTDPFDWGRFNVEQSDTAATLAGKLAGWYMPLPIGKMVRATLGNVNGHHRPYYHNSASDEHEP